MGFYLPAQALCHNLLVYDPLDRATVHAALKNDWFICELSDLEAAYRERIASG